MSQNSPGAPLPESAFVDLTARVRLPLDERNWIEVHSDIPHAEDIRVSVAGLRTIEGQPTDVWQPESFYLARLQAWLTGWGGPAFTERDGTSVTCGLPQLKALQKAWSQRILDALAAHIDRMYPPAPPPSALGKEDGATSEPAAAAPSRPSLPSAPPPMPSSSPSPVGHGTR